MSILVNVFLRACYVKFITSIPMSLLKCKRYAGSVNIFIWCTAALFIQLDLHFYQPCHILPILTGIIVSLSICPAFYLLLDELAISKLLTCQTRNPTNTDYSFCSQYFQGLSETSIMVMGRTTVIARLEWGRFYQKALSLGCFQMLTENSHENEIQNRQTCLEKTSWVNTT